MTNGYVITYSCEADEGVPAEIERLLHDIGAGRVTHEPRHRRFLVHLDSGAEAANPSQLKRHLAPVSNVLVAVMPYQPEKFQAEPNWNMAFTNMVRQTNAAAWGNWDFNPTIRAGAVGILDPDTGSFTHVATLENANIIDNVSYQAWAMESTSTQFSQSEVEFAGGYLDPSSGEEVNVGLEVSWSFDSANSMVSRATVSGRTSVNNFGVLLKGQAWEWLLAQAEGVGYTNDAGIVQGFGVVTSVTTCIGAVNIAAIEEQSSISLVGSIDGISVMTGGGTASAGVKGSYKEKKQSKAFNSHTWPVLHNTVVPGTGEVALFYQFTSFDGTTIMPTWAKRIGNFTITFANNNGGTYIGRCSVEYSVPGSDTRVEEDVRVSGGTVGSISGIPLNAYNLKIHVDFTSGGDDYFDIPSPLTQWLNGTCTVDLGGVWPWGSWAKIRAT